MKNRLPARRRALLALLTALLACAAFGAATHPTPPAAALAQTR